MRKEVRGSDLPPCPWSQAWGLPGMEWALICGAGRRNSHWFSTVHCSVSGYTLTVIFSFSLTSSGQMPHEDGVCWVRYLGPLSF